MSSTTEATPPDTSTILCCVCGVPIHPNSLNMCNNCLKNEVDVTKDISRRYVILQCRNCNRYLSNTKWVACDLESKELLALCLKKMKKLRKVKLVDAMFLWTEPHSKRLNTKLTVQGETFNNTIVQQSFVAEFSVENQQCDMCEKSFTENTWKACVQVRQRVDHKRSFFYLEQMILKHGLAKNITGMKEVPEGLNLYYESKSHASHLIEFLNSVIPIRHSNSKRLISQDFKSNLTKYKYTIFAEIAPICREDLVVISSKNLIKKLGGDCPLLLCVKITNQLTFVNPSSLKKVKISASDYFGSQFDSICNSRSLVQFLVIDVVFLPQNTENKTKYRKAAVECVRSTDVNSPHTYVDCTTHLGNVLHAGDLCLGYDLRSQNIQESAEAVYSGSHTLLRKGLRDLPQVILVRKVFERKKNRDWKLRRLVKKKFSDLADEQSADEDFEMASGSQGKTNVCDLLKKEVAGKDRRKKASDVAAAVSKSKGGFSEITPLDIGGSKRVQKARGAKSRRCVKGGAKGMRGRWEEDETRDEERFLEELEENPDMRQNVLFVGEDGGAVENETVSEAIMGRHEDGSSEFNLMIDE